MSKTHYFITLISSHGRLIADPVTGLVLDADPALGEWYTEYPQKTIAGKHDILDFGYWTADGYSEPCHDWRRGRNKHVTEDAFLDEAEAILEDARMRLAALIKTTKAERI